MAKQAIYGYSSLGGSHSVALKNMSHGARRIDAEFVDGLTTRYPDKAFRSMFPLWRAELVALFFMIDHLSSPGYWDPIKGTKG